MNKSLSTTELSEVIRRLRAVTRLIEGFFETHVDRLNVALLQLGELQSEYDVARRLSADLDQQRKQWQRERQAEMARLADASEALAESWQALDNQRRDQLLTPNSESPKPIMQPAPKVVATLPPHEPVCTKTSLFELQQLRMQVSEHARGGR